jgi:hypothetical protein
LQSLLIATYLIEITLLITQLIQTPLLLEHTLAVVQEILPALPILTITIGALLLFLLPVTILTPVVVVVAVVIAPVVVPIAIAIAILIAFPLLLATLLL